MNPDILFDHNSKISKQKKQIIMLESAKEYMAFSLNKKEAKVEKLHERVKKINNYMAYLESFLKKGRLDQRFKG